jgi:hypothetical protein
MLHTDTVTDGVFSLNNLISSALVNKKESS